MSSSPAVLELNLSRSIVSPSDSTAEIYWGLSIPVGTAVGNYSGQNSVVAEVSN